MAKELGSPHFQDLRLVLLRNVSFDDVKADAGTGQRIYRAVWVLRHEIMSDSSQALGVLFYLTGKQSKSTMPIRLLYSIQFRLYEINLRVLCPTIGSLQIYIESEIRST